MAKKIEENEQIENTTLLAARAVDNASPFTGDGSADFREAPENVTDETAKRLGLYRFGAIPANDHDTLTAQAAAEKIIAGEDLVPVAPPRSATHGAYADTARISQSLKRVVDVELSDRAYRGQQPLTDMQRENLDMICTQMARIIAGDSGHYSHWRTIGGYTRIVNGS